MALVGALLAAVLLARGGSAAAQGADASRPLEGGAQESPGEARTEASVDVWSLIDTALRLGPHHRIEEPVGVFGYQMSFQLETDFGAMSAESFDVLQWRLRELDLLAQIARLEESFGVETGAEGRAEQPAELSRRLLPSTVAPRRRGIAAFFDSPVPASPALSEGAVHWQVSESPEYEAVRREVAYRLRADVYTLNPLLQKALSEFAWAVWAGGDPEALSRIQPPEHWQPSSGAEDPFEQLIRDSSPADLQLLNRERLQELGAEIPFSERFLSQSWISPRRACRIVQDLEQLDGVRERSRLLELATLAHSEADAVFTERVVEMAAAYHLTAARLRRAFPTVPVPFFEDEHNRLVVLLPVDFLHWDSRAETLDRSASPELGEAQRLESRELWLSGWVSGGARRELEARGWRVHARAFAEEPRRDRPGEHGTGLE